MAKKYDEENVSKFAYDDLEGAFSNASAGIVKANLYDSFNVYRHYYDEIEIPYVSTYQLSPTYEPYPAPDIKNLIKKKPPVNKTS